MLVSWIVRILVKEHRGYRQRSPNDIEALRAVLRPGDVILVEGSQRISEVIKYLTQSSWSHAALYVGDAVRDAGGHWPATLTNSSAKRPTALLVEATVENGVAAGAALEVRRSQHANLSAGAAPTRRLDPVLDTVIAQIGIPYNVEHIVDLLRYFFPVDTAQAMAQSSATSLRQADQRSHLFIADRDGFPDGCGYPVQPTDRAHRSIRG